jgi:RHH-type proline utilization regulon transcriptional repressor/proline dehydrogenase/delta 1-pyrroline-5-carboxylate dehydrogenase
MAQPQWQATPPAERADLLLAAADRMEARMDGLIGLIVREAGKTLPNAIGEVREAVDFLRYYAATVRDGFDNATHRPLGPIVCISPWNFPLAIFTGQVAAALAAGNVVLAKPAEETPLIASLAVGLLHEAGVPAGAVQLLPGDGRVGAALIADPRVRGVMFTGSTDVARLINRTLAERLNPDGRPVPLIAETGGQNAMIVDSSALPEQVVTDVIASAFDSAGQRCSALRVLCLQDDIAERVLAMLKGAMAELAIGNPDRLSTDIGPVITDEARATILAHVAAMRARGHRVHALDLPEACREGSFVAPTLIELDDIGELDREVFGPVLHVVRFARDDLDALIDRINAIGYGLTFGVHSRIDETIVRATDRIRAGNIYVNRTMIGAVVGVQPFGGHGLSGTGPKAGGPLYLRRLLAARPPEPALPAGTAPRATAEWIAWLEGAGHAEAAARCRHYTRASRLGLRLDLPGPVGESNVYRLTPRGTVLCVPTSAFGLLAQIGAALATGNRAHVFAPAHRALLDQLPEMARRHVTIADCADAAPCAAVLYEGEADRLRALAREVAALDGPIRPIYVVSPPSVGAQADDDLACLLVTEQAISTNTAAAGGNASLMTIA